MFLNLPTPLTLNLGCTLSNITGYSRSLSLLFILYCSHIFKSLNYYITRMYNVAQFHGVPTGSMSLNLGLLA